MKTSDVRRPVVTPSTQAGQVGPVAGPEGGAPAHAQTLQAPPTTRHPLADQPNLRGTTKGPSSQVAVLADNKRRQGTRQKKLKTDAIKELGRLERPAFARLVGQIGSLLDQAKSAAGLAEGMGQDEIWARLDQAMEHHREELATSIQQAVRGPRSQLTKSGVDAMRASGTDTLMMQILARGKLSMSIVRAEMTRLSKGLREGNLEAADIKKGLVTADGLLQRLALAGAPLEYGYKDNGPRDLLLSFAASLHR
ncbi:MAG: hypothetical protein KC933_04255 [Myxococcales bacterium]|nr:hypothetical protein [Myxococcales bacterium]